MMRLVYLISNKIWLIPKSSKEINKNWFYKWELDLNKDICT